MKMTRINRRLERWTGWALGLGLFLPLIAPGQTDGTLRWTSQWVTGTVFLSSPALAPDGTIYIGTESLSPTQSMLFALNPASGTRKWMVELPDWIDSSPAVGPDGTIYVGCWNGGLYAVRPSGSVAWMYQTDNYIYSSPAVGLDGTVYVGSGDGNLHAINPNGTQKWAFPTEDWVDSSPAVGADGTVYVGSWDNSVYAIDSDGVLKWSYPTGGPVLSSPAIDAAGDIMVGSDDGSLYALSPTGVLRWKYPTGDSIQSSPAIGPDGAVFVGSFDGYLYALNPGGTLRWRYAIDGSIASSPAVRADGSVVFGGSDFAITCLNADGSLRWRHLTGDWVDSSAAIADDGTIYAGSFDNSVYALYGDKALVDSPWPKFRRDAGNTGAVPVVAPVIEVQPFSLVAAPGDRVLLQVVAGSVEGVSYEWILAGTPLPGVDGPILDLGAAEADEAGTYRVRVFNAAGEAWSDPATLEVVVGADSRLSNISTRGRVVGGSQLMIPGFVIQGSGGLSVLIRGVGPTLGTLGVAAANPNPRLDLVSGASILQSNDRWEDAPNLAELKLVSGLVGAFPLDEGSEDAAVLIGLTAGQYTAKVAGVDSAEGITLVEVYGVAETMADGRLMNISNRGAVGTGAAILIPGFVIEGPAARAVLIRGVGPSLSEFGVVGFLEDPRLVLLRGTESGDEVINLNDDWEEAPNREALVEAAALVGAFPLESGAADAAILTVLPPGKYTALLQGVDGGEGIGLVEVYRLP